MFITLHGLSKNFNLDFSIDRLYNWYPVFFFKINIDFSKKIFISYLFIKIIDNTLAFEENEKNISEAEL